MPRQASTVKSWLVDRRLGSTNQPPVRVRRKIGIAMSSAERVDLSIVIVSNNTRARTLAALDSIQRETREVTCEVIVVDNASSDGTVEAVLRHASQPRLVPLKQNIGFARASNLGAEYARAPYLLLLGSNTVILDRAIDQLFAFARKHRRAMIWGGRAIYADGHLNPSSCSGRLSPWSLACQVSGLNSLFPASQTFNGEAIGHWLRDQPREVDVVSSSFLMIPRSIWMALGGFDPHFALAGEDADLCLRAERLGARPMITPDATIICHGKGSQPLATRIITSFTARSSLIARHWPVHLRATGQNSLTLWAGSRWLGYRMWAVLSGLSEADADAKVWREVWQARQSWQTRDAVVEPVKTESSAASPLLPPMHSAS